MCPRLLHDNRREDLFIEVSHGPCLVDNNVLLSPEAILNLSNGNAIVHNLIAGRVKAHPVPDRFTPYHFPHSTEVAGVMTLLSGDDRYFNNIFISPRLNGAVADEVGEADRGDVASDLAQKTDEASGGLHIYDSYPSPSDDWVTAKLVQEYAKLKLPVEIAGNAYLGSAQPFAREQDALVQPDFDPGIRLEHRGSDILLHLQLDDACLAKRGFLVTTERLGKAFQPEMPFENPDGSPLSIAADYLGHPRPDTPRVGSFEILGSGGQTIKLR